MEVSKHSKQGTPVKDPVGSGSSRSKTPKILPGIQYPLPRNLQNLGFDRRFSVSSSWDGTQGSSESHGTIGGRRWKKQVKPTSRKPFKLRTEKRGRVKEEEFMKKIQEMTVEEEKLRIPIKDLNSDRGHVFDRVVFVTFADITNIIAGVAVRKKFQVSSSTKLKPVVTAQLLHWRRNWMRYTLLPVKLRAQLAAIDVIPLPTVIFPNIDFGRRRYREIAAAIAIVLIKPHVKEIIRPVCPILCSDILASERSEFDHKVAEKMSLIRQYKMERARQDKMAEEEEIKRLRKELVPKAQLLLFFDRPFLPIR
ncbi:40S ribosomal protein S19-3-like [Hibiscus syriacus]|uniref:40S ribosomal protein S19-3-like n=1 Tax=Hibiscus syriacus TaxID=106335 RepID=A0A6A3CIC0_HIBSY|nr:40S ribosomal protein S19-3-like [Hibiscus syriacus]